MLKQTNVVINHTLKVSFLKICLLKFTQIITTETLMKVVKGIFDFCDP